MGLSTWIFGGLGFVLGGPIGAIIGAVIGSVIDHTKVSYNTLGEDTTTSHSTTQGDISVSLLVLIACVMKADGKVLKAEVNHIKPYLVKIYGEEGGKQALHLLHSLLKQDIDSSAVAKQIGENVNYSTRLEIAHMLLDLAAADGDFDPREETLIRSIAQNMGLTTSDYESLLAIYQKSTDANWAYTALEIEPTATNEEVKRAYRRMAMKYHPDKVTNAGEEMKQKATEKFRAIHEAYEHIKTLRHMA